MSAITVDRTAATTTTSTANARAWLRDTWVFAGRNAQHIRRLPEKLLDVTVQPVMFTLLFAYVFGGAIGVPGGNYREYLIAGILVQSICFGMMGPASSIATDQQEGVIDRFRSLPAKRSAYLSGHFLAEWSGLGLAIVILLGSGLVVGWRTHTDVLDVATALVLAVAVRRSHGLGRDGDRADGADARRGHGGRLHHRLPADLREQRVRADRHPADGVAALRGVEPGERDGRRPPGAVRELVRIHRTPDGVAARARGSVRVPVVSGDPRHRGAAEPASLPRSHDRLTARTQPCPPTPVTSQSLRLASGPKPRTTPVV